MKKNKTQYPPKDREMLVPDKEDLISRAPAGGEPSTLPDHTKDDIVCNNIETSEFTYIKPLDSEDTI
ncbi:hypothetical protein [Clostridium tarantellae]|uniref:Uncharacterized protein n=1 Tax=Clostridium tarantellae TaxID=39493 RepID=A0A6I1MMM3_9CLOT|nr:hypothetical protein [Clostridium tarantellae]MPQ43377.1 hypothetical protein [Clostridium tarantellae]